MRCKCRQCQKILNTQEAYKTTVDNKVAYFCDEDHYDCFITSKQKQKLEKEAERQLQKEKREAEKQKQREAEELAKEKRQQEKDKAYYLICEIIGRKAIANTALWKEWALWNKVADNAKIGTYLEENKEYLRDTISKIENKEFNRIRYLSAILKNKLGDYIVQVKKEAAPKPVIQVETSSYDVINTNQNKRRSLSDFEEDF